MAQFIKSTPEKRCYTCGARMQRKRWNGGTLEDVTAYGKRQFCSLSCANSRSKGGRSRKAYCARARKMLKPCCEACGDLRRRCAHHVNEDWTDNRPENVQTLCIFCHRFWHCMHIRLGVKCSTRMPMVSPLLVTEAKVA
jgi:hypothetical protein